MRQAAMSLVVGLAGCYSGASVDADAPGANSAADSGNATGDDGDSSSDGGADSGGDDTAPDASCLDGIEPQSLRRLTPAQARNTMQDLFGLEALEISFSDEAEVITELGVRQLRSSAETVLGQRDAWTQEVFGCSPDGPADDACAEAFIRTFGTRVFRRPMTEPEVDRLMSVYESAIYGEQLSFSDSLDVVLATMLQSPEFLYVFEGGTPVEGAQGVVQLDGYALASRLSYFLWDSMPDEALFEAAASDALSTPDELSAQVARMLASPRAAARLRAMVTTWLHIDGAGLRLVLEELNKDPDLYPEFSPALLDAMRIEAEALVDRAVLQEDSKGFEDLLTSREAYVNASLASLYGVQGPADDDTWEWVTLPQEERAGILTRAAFLSVHAGQRVQSPIFRGVYVLEEILCADLGDPPPTANDTPIEEGDDPEGGPLTVREAVDARTMDDATCAACHALINPTGFLFEHYDAVGRWRTEEVQSGLPIDAAAGLTIGDVAAEMPDAVSLSESLAKSTDAKSCFAKRWVQEALETEGVDACTQDEVVTAFVETGDVRSLVEGIVRSPAFRYGRVGGGE